jgi:plasmid stabilization system protein ParE
VTRQLRVTKRAHDAIRRLRLWWVENRPAAPNAPAEDIDAALELLLEQPGIGQAVPQASRADTRRLFLDRLSSWLYYRATDKTLTLLTIWHTSRGRPPAV